MDLTNCNLIILLSMLYQNNCINFQQISHEVCEL